MLERLGILPSNNRGRITSNSMPFTLSTTTRGFGLAVLWDWPNKVNDKERSEKSRGERNLGDIGNPPFPGIIRSETIFRRVENVDRAVCVSNMLLWVAGAEGGI